MKTRRFPAEWEQQSMVQITWPNSGTDWCDILDKVLPTYSKLSEEITKRQPLLIVTRDKSEVLPWIQNCDQSRVHLVEMPINDTWARDHGFITVEENGHATLLDFQFNGWGLKFAADKDNAINHNLFESGIFSDTVHYENQLNVVFEGGSIESDGCGTLLTTSECLLSPNRNGKWDKKEIETFLLKTFGAKKLLWLDYGYLEGDDTDSHIDTLARLCPGNKILYIACSDLFDPHYGALKRMESQLKQFTNVEDKPFELVALPMCSAVYDNDDRLPATYANFLFINNAVLVPVYGVPEDEMALQIFRAHFPHHEIIEIPCHPLIIQHGSLHCITMQFPSSVQLS